MFEKKKAQKPQYDVNWYSDKYQSVVVTRDRLLLVTLLAIIGMGAMTFAMYLFIPLKTVKPFVIQIDENTGATKVAESKKLEQYKATEVLVKYFAMRYIYARENYNYLFFAEDSKTVNLMSAADVRSLYYASISPKNPTSPINVFGTNTERTARLNSFTFLNKNKGESTIQAKLEITEATKNRYPRVYQVEVTMSCSFNPDYQLSSTQRLVNPLGFVVRSYRVDEYRN